MKRIFILLVWFIFQKGYAQDLMRITSNDGNQWNFSINNIEEMKFTISKQLNIVGEWLSIIDNTIIRDIFYADGSYSSCVFFTPIYDNHYVEITEEPGTYSISNNIITIKRSDGITLRIVIWGFNDFQMTSESGDIYYKVQEPAYSMTTADAPIVIGNENDIIKQTDDYYTTNENNRIKAVTNGTGYVLVEENETKEMKAYRVDIDYVAPPIVDWAQYYNDSQEDIRSKFGDYDLKNEENTWVFMRYDAAIQSVEFTFTKDTNKVKEIEINFYDKDKGQPYYELIANDYNLYSSNGGVQMFVNPEKPNEIIYVNTTNNLYRIIYNFTYGE